MAVIRQQTQVFNKPVGVVRAASGSQELGRQISRAAGTITDIAYEKAAINAQEFGQEQALALEASQITAIDPATNKPVALTPPPGYGSIAAEAYQSIVNQRYESAIKREIEIKGAEIAESSPNSSVYKERMSEYISSMYNAEGEATGYSNYIQETGLDYVTKTYAALRNKEIVQAQSRLERDAKREYFTRIASIKDRIASGELNDQLDQDVYNLSVMSGNMFASNMLTAKQALEILDLETAISSMNGKSSLISAYQDADDAARANMHLAIINPKLADDIVGSEIGSMIRKSLADSTSDSLISVLKLTAESIKDRTEAMATEFRLSNPVSPMMTFSLVRDRYKDQPEDVRNEAYGELFRLKTEGYITEDSLPLMMRELSKPGMMNTSVFPEEVRELVLNLSADVKEGIVKDFRDRKALETAINDDVRKSNIENVSQFILGIESAGSVDVAVSMYSNAISAIENLDPAEQQEKIRNADATLAKAINVTITSGEIPIDRVRDIHSAITQNAESFDGTDEEKQYFSTLRTAYKASRTITAGAMEKRLNDLEASQRVNVADMQMSIIQTKLSSNLPVSDADMKIWGDKTYGQTTPTISNLINNVGFQDRMAYGRLAPQEIDAIKEGVNSLDADVQDRTFDIIRKLMNVRQSSDGIKRDVAVGILPSALYQKASSAISVANYLGIKPSQVINNLDSYNGDVNADLALALGVKDIRAVIKEYDLAEYTSSARNQLLDIARYSLASGTSMDESRFEEMKDRYESELTKDDRVLVSRVGEGTDFSMERAFSEREQIDIMSRVADRIIQDPEYRNAYDLGDEAPLKNVNQFLFGRSYSTQMLNNFIGDKVKFMPIEETWMGPEGNKSYYVMIYDGFSYTNMEDQNGEPMIVSQADYRQEASDVLSKYNRMIKAEQSGDPVGTQKTRLEYFLARDPELYMSYDSLASMPDYHQMVKVLGEEGIRRVYENVTEGGPK